MAGDFSDEFLDEVLGLRGPHRILDLKMDHNWEKCEGPWCYLATSHEHCGICCKAGRNPHLKPESYPDVRLVRGWDLASGPSRVYYSEVFKDQKEEKSQFEQEREILRERARDQAVALHEKLGIKAAVRGLIFQTRRWDFTDELVTQLRENFPVPVVPEHLRLPVGGRKVGRFVMLQQIRDLQIDRHTMEELVALKVFATGMLKEYEVNRLPAPEWLKTNTGELVKEIERKRKDSLEAALAQVKARRNELRTADEKRRDLEQEQKELELQLGILPATTAEPSSK